MLSFLEAVFMVFVFPGYHHGLPRDVGCSNKYETACQPLCTLSALCTLCFLEVDTAKLGTKNSPAEEISVGWELVGVLVGVLPFFGTLVGVFRFPVGVLLAASEWWEFYLADK